MKLSGRIWDGLNKIKLLFFVVLGIGSIFATSYLTNQQNLNSKAAAPTDNTTAPWVLKKVFAQNDFTQTSYNEVVGNAAFYPQGITVDRYKSPNRVYVWDSGNNRVLGFASLGKCNGGTNNGKACTNNSDCSGAVCETDPHKKADIYLGQPDEAHAACNMNNTIQTQASPLTLCSQPYPLTLSPLESQDPTSMAVDMNSNLYIYDKYNHRVLMYNDPFTQGVEAKKVWGQANFTDRGCNRGAGGGRPTAQSLCSNNETGFHISGDHSGEGVDVDPNGQYLWVADGANNRVLRFPTNGDTADLVLGQNDFTSNYSTACVGDGQTPLTKYLCRPKSVRINPTTGQLFVLDWPVPDTVVRVLIYNAPFTNGMEPSEVLIGGRNSIYPYNFNRSVGLEFDPNLPNGFWMSDWNNNRTIFLTKVSGKWTITKAIGQPNLTKTECGGYDTECSGTSGPPWICHACQSGGGIGIDNAGNYYVSDKFQNLVFRMPGPIPDGIQTGIGKQAKADAILFLPNNVDSLWNSQPNKISLKGTTTENFIKLITYTDGKTQMFLADQMRVLFWNDYASKPDQNSSADGYLYQPNDDVNSGSFAGPFDTDGKNHVFIGHQDKIDIFDGPVITKQAPSQTIGPTIKLRFGGTINIDRITGMAYDKTNNVLWVADNTSHRVLRISNPLDSQNLMVDMVLGQPNINSTYANRGKDGPDAFPGCPHVVADGFANLEKIKLDLHGNLYIADGSHEGWQCSNNRMLEYDASDLQPDPSTNFFANGVKVPKRVYGAKDFISKGDNNPVSNPFPKTPISVSFDGANHMMMVVDGYGNGPNQRVFWYDNPTPDCTSPCSVTHTSIIPFTVSQASDIDFDPVGRLVILDHTWNRTLLFENQTIPLPTNTPTPTTVNSPTPTNIITSPTLTPKRYSICRNNLCIQVNCGKKQRCVDECSRNKDCITPTSTPRPPTPTPTKNPTSTPKATSTPKPTATPICAPHCQLASPSYPNAYCGYTTAKNCDNAPECSWNNCK